MKTGPRSGSVRRYAAEAAAYRRTHVRLARSTIDVFGRLAFEASGNASRMVETRITDLSIGGARLVLPSSFDPSSSRTAFLTLPGQSGFVTGKVRLVYIQQAVAPELGWDIGVSFVHSPAELLLAVCALLNRFSRPAVSVQDLLQNRSDLSVFEKVTQPGKIRRVLCRIVRNNAVLQIYDMSQQRVASFRPSKIERETVTGTIGQISNFSIRVGGKCLLCTPIGSSFAAFDVCFIGMSPNGGVFSLPDSVYVGAVRRHNRVCPGGDGVVLEFLHPAIRGKVVQKSLIDLSIGGMRFSYDLEEDLIAPGTALDAAMLRFPDGQSIGCRCLVRHVSTNELGKSTCGLEFVGSPRGERESWVNTFLSMNNPSVEEVTPENVSAVWDVLKHSGYVSEKPGERITQVSTDFGNVWRNATTRADAARGWVYRHGDRNLGSICATKIYSKTWLVHQMAVDGSIEPVKRLKVLSDLVPHALLQWLPACNPDDNVLTYFNGEQKFNKTSWFDFFDAHSAEWRVRTSRFFACDFLVKDLVLPNQGKIETHPASADELGLIVNDLLHRETEFVRHALDYDLSPMRSINENAALRVLGFERQVWMATRNGKCCGYGIFESADEGINVFGLYNSVRCFLLTEDNPDDVQIAILRAAQQYYRCLNIRSFFLLRDAAMPPLAAEEQGFTVPLVRAVIAGSLLPLLGSHLSGLWEQI